MTDSKYTRQTVTRIHTWVPGKLFSVCVTRDPAFRFQAGQFARVGLPAADDPGAPPTVWRAYSMVSAPPEDRSEERRVGKACVSTCRSRWSPSLYNNKPNRNKIT